ncbi:MAG: plasmid recombination protein [Prevotella sp.]|nr:plasmid recombination protein [Prevotella sp.]
MAKGDRFVVLTMDKQTGNAGGLSAHIDREVYDANLDRMVTFRPKSVRDDSRTALNRECIEGAKKVGRTQAIWNRLKEEGFSRESSGKKKIVTKGEKKTRKIKDDAVIALCFICSSDEETMKQFEKEGRLDDWIDSTLGWFKQEFGDKNVVSAVLHMDETTPHLHVTVVPITYEEPKPRKEKPKFDERGKPLRKYETDENGNIILDESGRAIVKKRTYKKQEVTARLSAKDICNPVAMERWQTGYAKAMAPFGLRRGIAGSKQKRVPPAEWNLQQVNGQLMAVEKEIEEKKAEITKMAQASWYDKIFNSGLSPTVRKVLEDKEKEHKEELRQATTAVDEDGRPYVWTSGSKKDQDVTWEELAKFREKEKKKAEIQAKADKEAAVDKALIEAKAEHDAEIAEMKKLHASLIDKERYAVNEKGQSIYWSGGFKDGQKVTKDERIKWLSNQLEESKEANKALRERLKVIRELIFATCNLNFTKVVQIIVDQWKTGIKQFTKDLKDFLQKAMSGEKTVDGRKSYVNDAFDIAKMSAMTDTDWEPDGKALKPLYEDALKIADGTWDAYHQQRDQLFKAAINAVAEMGNNSCQRHLNQKQAETIETFLNFDGGDRKQLCDEIWDSAKDKVHHYWFDGTYNALKELCTRALYSCNYGTSISHSSRHI